MRKLILFILVVVLFASCATIPRSSLTLNETLTEEATRMHQLNVELVNIYFEQRSKEIDEYIAHTYVPTMLTNIRQALIEADLYTEENFMSAISLAQVKIIEKRDLMQQELEKQRIAVINELYEDYETYSLYTTYLHNMLESAVRVQEERDDLIITIDNVTKNKLNIQELDDKANNILIEAGKISSQVEDAGETTIEIIDKAQDFFKKNKDKDNE